MRCRWKTLAKGEPCINCGFKLPWEFKKPPYRSCRYTGPCAYLGEATVKLLKASCKDDPQLVAHLCLHPERSVCRRQGGCGPGLCTPDGKSNDAPLVMPCRKCPLFEAPKPSAE